MARGRASSTVKIYGEKLDKHIKEIEGKNFKGVKISTFILGADQTYYSKSINSGTININQLDKLCAYYDLDKNDYIVTTEEPKPVTIDSTSNNGQLDTIIVGLNVLYEAQKQNNELMSQMLEQLKIVNTRVNRLENAIGQIVSNSIQIKELGEEAYKETKEVKSSVAIINGRVRDILQIQNKK